MPKAKYLDREFKECTLCNAEDPKPHTKHDGEELELVTGEKIVVMKTEILQLKKNGKITGELQRRIMAQSGDTPVWFPAHMIKAGKKEEAEDDE